MKIKKVFFFLIIFFIFLLGLPLKTNAVSQAQAENINVAAKVASPVSPITSKVEISTTQVLADPISHSVLLTIVLKDKNGKPLADKEVKVYSNRGDVDVIEAVSKINQFKAHGATISDLQTDRTDENGWVAFRISSFMPGTAIITIIADNIVTIAKITLVFLAPPFPANFTVSIGLPGLNKELTLLSPESQEENLSLQQKEAKKFVNTGTKIKFPFWFFAIIVILIIGAPIFAILNFIHLRKLRKTEKQEIELLKQIASASDINQLKDGIQADGFNHKNILNQSSKTPPPK